MDIKIGDYLLCKEDFYIRGELTFEKDKCYQIYDIEVHNSNNITVELESTNITVELESTHFWYKTDLIKHPECLKWYVWTYFYTPAESRQKQIDSVIN